MTDLERDEAMGARPLTDLERDEAAGAKPYTPAAPSMSAHPVRTALKNYLYQPFADIASHVVSADRAIGNAIVHPVDTFRAIRAAPSANAREVMRGVNDNIPFANRAVEAIGGPAASSPEDARAALPGARDVGGVAGLPASTAVGGIVGKGVELTAPVVAKALSGIGDSAASRVAARAAENAPPPQLGLPGVPAAPAPPGPSRLGAMAKRIAEHAVVPAVVGSSHGLTAGLATAAGQEVLHALPGVARGVASVADRAIAPVASGAARVTQATGAVGDLLAREVARGNPKALALVQAVAAARKAGPTAAPVGTVSTSTLEGEQ